MLHDEQTSLYALIFYSSLYSSWNDLKHMFPLKRASIEQNITENQEQLELIRNIF